MIKLILSGLMMGGAAVGMLGTLRRGKKMKLQEAVGKNFWLSADELHVELSNLDGWEEDGG